MKNIRENRKICEIERNEILILFRKICRFLKDLYVQFI